MSRLPFRRPMGRVGAIAAFASHGDLTGRSLPHAYEFAASDARGVLPTAGGVRRPFEF
jgi:hypothetical protein